jgi:hypothetical protein
MISRLKALGKDLGTETIREYFCCFRQARVLREKV